jgi:hypothetical protein
VNESDDDRDPWQAEAEAFAENQYSGDWEVAAAAELPNELHHHVLTAELDPRFEDEFDEWLDYLIDADEHTLMLAIEQSCDDGMLLPWDMRAVRLDSLPADTLARLHWLLGACPRHVLVHLVLYVYWLTRSERARRRGSPVWWPSLPLWPEPEWQKEPPAFKPMRSWPRRWP